MKPIIKVIHEKIPYDKIDIGIVCGSGLAHLTNEIVDPITIQYSEQPNFPHSKVDGHKNEQVIGKIGDKIVCALRGRFHFYEGWEPKDCVKGIILLSGLGVKAIVITNAAGGLNPDFTPGDLMLINGHVSFITMTGIGPQIGPNDKTLGPRFPSVSSIYDEKLGNKFKEIYKRCANEKDHKRVLHEGAYAGLAGPSYETRHEIEMLRILGLSSVGMSTTMEVIQAAHCGVKVLGLSLITNRCLGTRETDYNLPEPCHEEVLNESKKVESFVQYTVSEFIKEIELTDFSPSPMAELFSREKMK